jgi:hypothetical protein
MNYWRSFSYVKRNSQQELVEFLRNNPFTSERDIIAKLWIGQRADKKHYDLVRRALRTNKIKRARAKSGKQSLYHYYVPCRSLTYDNY